MRVLTRTAGRGAGARRASRIAHWAAALAVLLSTGEPLAATGGPAVNFVQATPTIATAGMPTRAQLPMLAAAHAAVINLAPAGAMGSHADEQSIVEAAGARYVHVPVDFGKPTAADYERFARELSALAGSKVFVHCQVNMRASVFVFLYRTIELGEDPERAYDDVLKVWQPNAVWSRFARSVLTARGIKPPVALA